MPIKVAKTRKQTKLKFRDSTSLLPFYAAHETTKVSCPAIWQPLYLAALSFLLLTCTVLEHQIPKRSHPFLSEKAAMQTLLKIISFGKKNFPVAHMQQKDKTSSTNFSSTKLLK
jgi:protein involved in ribonucleotide reduction